MLKKEKTKTEKNRISMKEAFRKVSPRVVGKKKGNSSKVLFRDFLWNYPENLARLFKITTPLSTILIFSIFGFGIFTFLRSDIFAQNISSRKYTQYTEGRVGSISTLNPLFSNQNDIDKGIQELVFEKFIHIDKDGTMLPGIATSWDISEEGKIYQFNISDDHMWSDNTPLTLDDILFTFNTAIALYKENGTDTVGSALVDTKIEKIDDDSLKFTLPVSNATFPEIVSVYIVPKHILEDVKLENMLFDRFSANPVGSGPYRILRSEPNIVYLESSSVFKPQPQISDIVIRIYSDVSKLESAFRNGVLDGIVLPDNTQADFTKEYSSFVSHSINLPFRERVLFFNLRNDKFKNKELRKGITYLINRDDLLSQSGIAGTTIYGPIYEGSWAYAKDIEYLNYNPQLAIENLKSAGYTKNEQNGYYQNEDGKILTLTISYLENESNNNLLNTLKELLDKEGVIVNLEPFSFNQLTKEIIATRDFDLIMYEIELSIDPDQYNLWHSLQKEFPNLNLSGYEYERIDIILEDGRTSNTKDGRIKLYSLFQKYLVADAPAIFMYRPSYLYVVRDNIKGINFDNIIRLEDIYLDVYNWSFSK
jgi:peptide/nickel transport system substrate-binding protein